MPRLLPLCRLALAALLPGLPAAHAEPAPPRAVLQPAAGVEIGYQHLAGEVSREGPGRFDGALATPAGTLRSTVRVEGGGEQRFERGDTSLELPLPGLHRPGQLQVRRPEAGGTVATWRAPLEPRLAAETLVERTPTRSAEGLQLQHSTPDGDAARARMDLSRTDATEGSRMDVELSRALGRTRWTVGVDAAARGYVSAAGGAEPRGGLRLGTQWPVDAHTRMEVRFARHVHWHTDEATASLKVGAHHALPRRASLATGVEVDAAAIPKATVTLTVPLEAP